MGPQLTDTPVPWCAHPDAAPFTDILDNGHLVIAANGTRFCSGGWHVPLPDLAPGSRIRLVQDVMTEEIRYPRDALCCTIYWGDIPTDAATVPLSVARELLPARLQADGTVRFEGAYSVPHGCEQATLRCTLRWTDRGRTCWGRAAVAAAPPEDGVRPGKVCVVTGEHGKRPRAPTVADNVRFYSELSRAACRSDQPDLLLLPEIALQWGVSGHPWTNAVRLDGPEMQPFARLAGEFGCYLAVGLHERNGDAYHNSVAMLRPDGTVGMVYRKIHLAVGGENEAGVLPGTEMPVEPTPFGRVAANICMDSSAAESSRLAGLAGAEILLIAIMGDHRASRWTPGTPLFHVDRWQAVMRTHAMDNQVVLAAARNQSIGSCIVDRNGRILAWNEGDRPHITAEVQVRPDPRTWNAHTFRGINWIQRRPHVYTPFTDEDCYGSLTPP